VVSISGKVGQGYFGRYLDGVIRTVEVAEKTTVTVSGIGNIRESRLIQPDRVRVATLHDRTPDTRSQRAGFTFVSGNVLDRQVVSPQVCLLLPGY